MGVVQSPAVYSNPFLTTRQDAKGALLEERYRLEAKAWMGWIPDVDNFGLHKYGKQSPCIHVLECVRKNAPNWCPMNQLE